MANDEIPFREAGKTAGLAYNTIKRRRYQRTLPFPVYERTITPGKRPMLYCLASEIEAWKQRTTSRIPAGS